MSPLLFLSAVGEGKRVCEKGRERVIREKERELERSPEGGGGIVLWKEVCLLLRGEQEEEVELESRERLMGSN